MKNISKIVGETKSCSVSFSEMECYYLAKNYKKADIKV